jgi:hypothetical protein
MPFWTRKSKSKDVGDKILVDSEEDLFSTDSPIGLEFLANPRDANIE